MMTTVADVPDVDDEGYPTDAALARIREWPWKDMRGLMAFVRSVWWCPDWGWTEGVEEGRTTYALSTGGWSGNEDVIEALQRNTMFWLVCWRLSRRGGHYEFQLPEWDTSGASAAQPPSDAVAPAKEK